MKTGRTKCDLCGTAFAVFWRRERDSNPCGREPKRFSRPPRYDHFDIPPNEMRRGLRCGSVAVRQANPLRNIRRKAKYPSVNMMQQRASYLRSLEDGARRACSSNPLSLPHSEIDKLAVACAECGYLRHRRTIPFDAYCTFLFGC